ncbi:MAG: adenylate kinase [Rickettsiales bacterium]|nr:adenylate kinase [Rickettsiales bacterium]
MILILLGPPGAGKGTQADNIKAKLNAPKLSTGDMLREAAASDSDLGNELKSIMSAGQLVSDDIMIEMIRQRVTEADCANGFILDGFPRTLGQAEALTQFFQQEGLKLNMVLELKVDEEALVERIAGRFACAKCGDGYHDTFKAPAVTGKCDKCGSTEFSRRSDDNAETVSKRLEAYRDMTAPLLPYYEQQSVLKQVDAMASITEVTVEIEKLLDTA